jgi:hypothetical protein
MRLCQAECARRMMPTLLASVSETATTFVRRWFAPGRFHCLCLAGLLALAGCASRGSSTAPAVKSGSIRRESGKQPKQIPPGVLTAEVCRFADEFTILVAQAADTFAGQVGTPEARALALGWKTAVANTTMINATGPNPTANLLDMVVLVSLARMAFEEYWVPHYGKPAEPMLTVTRDLERDVWEVADRVLNRAQQIELKELIHEWREKHPEQVYISVRLRDFAELAVAQEPSANTGLDSLLKLSFLDPFSGLDPTTRELAQTRFFAERALYVLERMPRLLRWQSELLVAQTLAAPEVQQLVSNSTGFAQSADQLTKAVQQFPEQVAVEREKIMKGLETQTPEFRALSAQFEQTFQAGNEMAKSVDAAVKSLDGFIRSVKPPAASQSETQSAAPHGKPFDVTEYGAAAAEISKAAQQLDSLTHSLEKTKPEVAEFVQHAGMQGKELVDYAFHKALLLIVVALAGIVITVLACRWLTPRNRRSTSTESTGKG